jgi:hypothetical protein
MTNGIDQAPPPAPATEEAPAAAKSGFDRVVDVLFAPAATFRDIARRPDFLVPLAVILIVSIVAAVIIAPRVDFASTMREQMTQANKNMSEEDIDRVVRFSSAFARAMLYVSPLLNLIIFAIIAGVLLLAFRLFGGEGTYKQAYSVTAYSWMPLVISSIIGIVILLMRGEVGADELNNLVKSNLGFFVDMKANPTAFAILSSFDLFTIWSLSLFIIGFSVISRLSRGRSAAIVVTLWLVMIVVKVAFAALGAARAGGA